MSLFWDCLGFDWLVDRKHHSIIWFLRRSETNNCIRIAKLFSVLRVEIDGREAFPQEKCWQ